MNAAANPPSEQSSVRLTDSQLRELMRLVKGANSVELKLTVPATAHRATIQGLPMDPVEAQPRQIYFFDTPDLKLFNAGVVVRARRRAGGAGDTVVKLRPVDPEDIPQDLKNDAAFNIEVDALPGGFVCSASYKGRSNGQLIRDAVSGKKRLSKIFSKAQRAYYKAHAGGIDMDSLVPLGPTFILKGRFDVPMGLDGKTPRSMVAEVWLYPDGSRILEVHQVPPSRCARGRVRHLSRLPRRPARANVRRAGDQDEDGIGVLLEGTRGRAGGRKGGSSASASQAPGDQGGRAKACTGQGDGQGRRGAARARARARGPQRRSSSAARPGKNGNRLKTGGQACGEQSSQWLNQRQIRRQGSRHQHRAGPPASRGTSASRPSSYQRLVPDSRRRVST